MSQTYDEWKAAKARRDAAKEALTDLASRINGVVSELETTASTSHGEATQAMVPSLANWPEKEVIQRAVREFNAAHLEEWQKFEALSPADQSIVSASRK